MSAPLCLDHSRHNCRTIQHICRNRQTDLVCVLLVDNDREIARRLDHHIRRLCLSLEDVRRHIARLDTELVVVNL